MNKITHGLHKIRNYTILSQPPILPAHLCLCILKRTKPNTMATIADTPNKTPREIFPASTDLKFIRARL